MKNKIDLYIDFDGVLMDTNITVDSLLREFNIKEKTREEELKFLSKLKWNIILKKSNEINRAFSAIRALEDSGYFNVTILTHTCSKEESMEKVEFIRNNVGEDIKVMPVPRNIAKCIAVNAKGAILVDDYSNNLDLWQMCGGISIKFTESKHKKFTTINNLLDLLDDSIIETNKQKVLI